LNIIVKILEKLFNWGVVSLYDKTTDKKNEICVRLNPINLKFPNQLEIEYLKYFKRNSKLQIKISSVVGGLFFVAFFPFDIYLVPELFSDFFILRIIVSIFIVSVAFFASRLNYFEISQFLLSAATIIVGCIDILFIVIAFPKLNDSYYVGIILIYFWSFVFLKLRYYWAAFSGLSIFVIYVFATNFLVNLEPQISFISTFYLFAANIAGIGISYALEYYSRKEFFQQIMIKNSLDINFDLKEKISESKKVISQAQEKLMLQSKAIESAANCIVIVNKRGNIIFCNSAVSVATGYNKEELLGKNPRIFKSGKHDHTFYKNIWTTILSGNVWSGEIINKKKNGELVYEEMMIAPVTETGSKIISHFIAIKQDVSSRKEMEKNLLESERRFRSLFENATLGLYRTSECGKV
jgi:PAS domain S-box-containing protein